MDDSPRCPACGAKFSLDKKLQRCRRCLLPNEVRAKGEEAIAAWKEQTEANKRLFGRQRARVAHEEAGKPERKAAKRRNRHGRVGVKRAAR